MKKNQKKYLLKLLILLIVVFFTDNTMATNYYVSLASEISSKMQIASPGDTLIMTIGDWINQRIIFEGNGTAENPIVLKAEAPGFVVLKGTSTLRISGTYLVVDGLHFIEGYSNSGAVIEFRNGSSKLSNNCRLTNTAVINYNPTSTSTNYKWISLYGKNNRVDHCFTSGKKHNGTTLVVWLNGDTNYHKIDSNYFGARPELGVNGGETIRIGTSDYSQTDSYTLVENNYFERCSGEIEIISNKSGHNTYRYNTFYECEGSLTLRHGKYAEVYGNFFLGNKKSNTGGVRIIDEDHKVFNNYFQDLKGSGYRSALAMMNGVPNSPLNRYFQVKRAEVVNNTFVNCANTFTIGAGSDDEKTLPPLDCKIANNVVISNYQVIDYDDDPTNMVYENNIMKGSSLGIDLPDGITIVDPELSEAGDFIWRPSVTSPVINSGTNNYSYVTDDFDGHSREGIVDIGGDEVSDLLPIRRPLTSNDVGPSWYPLPEIPAKAIYVQAGVDSLLNAIAKVDVKDTLVLITDGGVYSNTSELQIDKKIIIKSGVGLSNKPEIRNINSTATDRAVFVMMAKGDLSLDGVQINGMAGTSLPVKYLFRSDLQPVSSSYKLKINNCTLFDVDDNGEGNFLKAFPGTFADTILISNSLLTNCAEEGFVLKDEAPFSSKYNVDYFEISNSTVWNIKKEAVHIYAGDNVLFTPGPKIVIEHSTFDSCGYSGTQIIFPEDCDGVEITNSLFTNGDTNSKSISLYGLYTVFEYNDLYDVGEVEFLGLTKSGDGIVNYNPLFEDAQNGDFTLPANSPILNKANDGLALGDMRWAINPPSYFTIFEQVEGEGNILYSPESISNDYQPSTIVTLTAIPDNGYKFVSWSGDVTSTDSIIQITMDDDYDIIASFSPTVDVENELKIPTEYVLKQNYPNPFNPSTTIEYSIPTTTEVKISIYDVRGKLIEYLVNKSQQAGSYKLSWHPENVSSGLYILRMSAGSYLNSKKILLLK